MVITLKAMSKDKKEAFMRKLNSRVVKVGKKEEEDNKE